MAAVLSVDIKGYSLLMAADEEGTHARVGAEMERVERAVTRGGGRVFSRAGDGLMAEFPSAVEALKCALRVQRDIRQRSQRVPAPRRIQYRIGINSGDIVGQDGRLGGDAVNVAARLEQAAEVGSIYISGAVFEQVGQIVPATYHSLGDRLLKNIRRPIAIWRVTDPAPKGTAAAPPPAPAALEVGDDHRPSLAVLPFRTLGEDQSDAYFAAGMVDDIINALAGLRDLVVVARSSTLGYGSGTIDARQVGRELNVRYLLHGSVRRAGTALRVAAELIETEADRVMWADRFDGALGDLFALQDEISLRVTRIIAPHVREWELRRAARKRPESMTAYDLVLQALDQFHRNEPECHRRAGALLEDAVRHDRGYAPGHSYTALWYMLGIAQGWSADPAADTEAGSRAAAEAIAREGNDAQALAWFGHAHAFLRHDYATALHYLDRALTVGPSCAMAWSLSSLTNGYLGHTATAVAHASRGVRLAPIGPEVYMHQHFLSQAHYLHGAFEDAVTWGAHSFAQNPMHASNLRVLIASLVAVDRLEEAARMGRRLLEREPGFSLARFAARTPLPGAVRDTFTARLRQAGLPE